MRELFSWLPKSIKLKQVAIFPSHPQGRNSIADGAILSVDELIAEIRLRVMNCGPAYKNAIPETFPLLRTIQLSHVGYHRVANHEPILRD